MVLEFILPFGNKSTSAKNIIFSILVKESPLKIIELTNYIRKRYGKSITFQAVRKAVLELVREGVLTKKDKGFSINKAWVLEVKQALDKVYNDLIKEKVSPMGIQSITGELSVFTFESINELMKFWQELIDNWFKNFKKGDYPINCYQAAHIWEVLLHLEQEEKIMKQLKQKGIKSYTVITSNTPLDKKMERYYRKIGVKTKIDKSSSSFDKSYYVGTYGDLVVQTVYPKKLVKELDLFFKANRSLEELDLSKLLAIVNQQIPVKLTVIQNLEMAKQINKSILSQIE